MEFVQKKGTPEQITEYYLNQQRQLLTLAQQSQLPHVILDATNKDYDSILGKLLHDLDI